MPTDCACAQSKISDCINQLCIGGSGYLECGSFCAAPDTPILTPSGEQPLVTLRAGDLVYSMDHARLAAVPIVATNRTRVEHHRVVRVALDTGRVLLVSPGHPTAEGGTFADLHAGSALGALHVATAALVDYPHDFTYDILPASDTGTYVAAGALIGSTLKLSNDACVARSTRDR